MDGYTKSDHKAMVSEVFLEITEISRTAKEMKRELVAIRDDIEQLNRSVHDFKKTMKEIQQTVPVTVAESAMISFDEQLRKIQPLQDLLDKLSQGDVILSNRKRRWFRG